MGRWALGRTRHWSGLLCGLQLTCEAWSPTPKPGRMLLRGRKPRAEGSHIQVAPPASLVANWWPALDAELPGEGPAAPPPVPFRKT